LAQFRGRSEKKNHEGFYFGGGGGGVFLGVVGEISIAVKWKRKRRKDLKTQGCLSGDRQGHDYDHSGRSLATQRKGGKKRNER